MLPSAEELKAKQARIKREKTKLRRLLKGVQPDRLKAAETLIDKVAFMAATLEELQVEINKSGCVSEYQNGENQWGTKKSPEVEVYSSLMQRYLPAMKQLVDLLPEDSTPGGKQKDPLLGYIEG